MNSYSLNINISWLIAIISIIVAFTVSIYYYRNSSASLSRLSKNILIILRGLALSLLIFMLFEPIFVQLSGKIIPPKIAVLVDNSVSAGLDDGKYDRKKIISDILKRNKFLFDSENPVIIFDNNIRRIDYKQLDSLKFNGQLTNISAPIDFVNGFEKDNNIKAVVLITDGVVNTGPSPIYSSEKLNKPIYTIGIGDTISPEDIIVKSIITNDNIAIGSTVPVNAYVRVVGFQSESIKVALYDNSELVSSQTFSIVPGKMDYNLVFDYAAKKSGTRKLTIKTDAIEGEVSLKNNYVTEFVKVTDKKKKILLLAGAPGPDLTFIANALTADKTVELRKFVQKLKSEFYDRNPVTTDIQWADAIYLIGFPNTSTPNNLMPIIKSELEKNKPLFFIASNDLDYSKLKVIDAFLPFSVLSSNSREYTATAFFSDKSKLNPLLRTSGNDEEHSFWNEQPPLFRTETFVKVKPEAEVLANVRVNTNTLNEPFIMTRQFSNQKTIAVLGYGLYRWKLTGYALEKYRKSKNQIDLFSKFIENSNSWLTTDANKKNVTIKPVSKVFQKNDKVEFYAQVNDAANNPVENAEVRVKISGGEAPVEITLNSTGTGRYSGYADGLPQGDYYYQGKATKNGTILGEDKGRFDIGDIPLEYQDLRMNFELLNIIAKRTGGKFYFNSDTENLENDIKNNKNFSEDDIVIKTESALWNSPLFLILAILLFVVEWFLRKRFGLL